MSVNRPIQDNRSTITFGILLVLTLVSLASGSQGGVVGNGVKTVVGIVVMPLLTIMNTVENGFTYATGIFLDYRDLKQSNQDMQLKFTKVQQDLARLNELESENARLRLMLEFDRLEDTLELLPAEVIQHSRGVLTLNRGTFHGVKQAMCVITAEGIIGLVTHSNPLTSSVITLQNADCKIDAMISWNRVRGQVQGTGNDLSAICTMHYIDLNDNVRDGDIIVTSPDSIFPSGYPIGWVVGSPERGQFSQSANIVPAADPFSVDEVFILTGAVVSAEDLAEEYAYD